MTIKDYPEVPYSGLLCTVTADTPAEAIKAVPFAIGDTFRVIEIRCSLPTGSSNSSLWYVEAKVEPVR